MSVIIPGILEKEWSAIEKKIQAVRPFAKSIHIDLLDGKFADNISFLDPEPFQEYTKDITFELHLMVDDPLQYVKPFAAVGFRRFLGQIEMMPNQTEFVAEAEQYGEVGLVFDAQTSLHKRVAPLHDLDTILIMTVKAGFSGQTFLPAPLHKITQILKEDPQFLVEVDGGITKETLPKAYAAGARRFVATSAIFDSDDPEKAYSDLSGIVARAEEASVTLE